MLIVICQNASVFATPSVLEAILQTRYDKFFAAYVNFDKNGINKYTVYFDYNESRQKVFRGLTPGKTYFIYVFATNLVSVSPLSDYRQIMATQIFLVL